MELPHEIFVATDNCFNIAILNVTMQDSSKFFVFADLAGDYQNASSVGDMSIDASITGTVEDVWDYYADDDGVVGGDEEL